MGYFCTTHKEGEELDIARTDFLLATDEEMNIATLAFESECEESLSRLKKSLPEDLASIVYKKILVLYIREVQEWMDTVDQSFFGTDNKPSESDEAVRRIFSNDVICYYIEKYQRGVDPFVANDKYFIYSLPDEKVLEMRGKDKKYIEPKNRSAEEGMLPIGSAAYNLIEYDKVVPVTITDRKGFLYYCEAEDGHQYIVCSHRIFATMEEAEAKITERNSRRDAAIEKYRLLEPSDDERLDQSKQMALRWLSFNRDPPKLMVKELKAATRKTCNRKNGRSRN